MVAPSNYSTDFLFPGVQSFYKDFILSAECSSSFLEQLKICLCNELIESNDSSYETLNLNSENIATKHGMDNGGAIELVVRPQTLSIMVVLAKFLGFLLTKPYSYDGVRNSMVDSRQLHLRNMVSLILL